MNKSVESGDWAEYQRLVLNELERHNMLLGKMDEKLGKVSTEIAMLKVKSGLWGMAGAAIPVGIAVAMKLISVQ
tara:strand:+ start:5599 stop:5820 length:222 start_codon:yes stop_codon:yes gene_type:complete